MKLLRNILIGSLMLGCGGVAQQKTAPRWERGVIEVPEGHIISRSSGDITLGAGYVATDCARSLGGTGRAREKAREEARRLLATHTEQVDLPLPTGQ